MTVNRTPEALEMLTGCVDWIDDLVGRGARSVRVQFDVEDHSDPLTVLGRRDGILIIEPGSTPVSARDWLNA